MGKYPQTTTVYPPGTTVYQANKQGRVVNKGIIWKRDGSNCLIYWFSPRHNALQPECLNAYWITCGHVKLDEDFQ